MTETLTSRIEFVGAKLPLSTRTRLAPPLDPHSLTPTHTHRIEHTNHTSALALHTVWL